ncbi:PD-(D/E)XK nuclease family protein [Coleofasciculus sp. FACHB-T130]|uniref:PD-(D/E)XK nuclease family protein n=1 Tax=Cyanophyceae TaxID=3028117 RepID=UPI00168205CF|nr:PD-(D/E)XK nuclease family protein [Coleofasciculus sp. FACHB-T130]MBD1881613.1 PD-(D/E)XK nuclease family protein [Coleofasciculus sp. FACHB-T130]
MTLNINLLPHHRAKTLRESGKQYYVDAKGDRFPSVSTILNATKPQEDREALFNWRNRVGAEEANRISGAASRRGTSTHKHIQRYLLGENVACPDAAKPYWDSIEPVLQDIHEVRLVEGSVFHYDLSYAGRVDCVASYKGIPCVCDWKTADKPKGSVERLRDSPLQLAAYMGAVNKFYQEYGIHLRHALLVVAVPEMPAEVFWFEPDNMMIYWQQWERRVGEFWQRRGTMTPSSI